MAKILSLKSQYKTQTSLNYFIHSKRKRINRYNNSNKDYKSWIPRNNSKFKCSKILTFFSIQEVQPKNFIKLRFPIRPKDEETCMKKNLIIERFFKNISVVVNQGSIKLDV